MLAEDDAAALQRGLLPRGDDEGDGAADGERHRRREDDAVDADVARGAAHVADGDRHGHVVAWPRPAGNRLEIYCLTGKTGAIICDGCGYHNSSKELETYIFRYSSPVPITVVIADDHPIVLDGLAQLFALESAIQGVARCKGGEEALQAVERVKPAVLVLEVRMPVRDGMTVLRELVAKKSPARVVMLTAEMNDTEVLDAIRLGVCAIVLKERAPQTLLQAVRAAARGEQMLDDRTVRGALDHLLRPEASAAAAPRMLTPRELDSGGMA